MVGSARTLICPDAIWSTVALRLLPSLNLGLIRLCMNLISEGDKSLNMPLLLAAGL